MTPVTQDRRVAVITDRPGYSRTPPFAPSEAYREWPAAVVSKEDNPAFRAVRAALRSLELDAENFGTAAWNPLGALIRPGNRVVIKPNLVSHRNIGERAFGITDTDSLVTHGSVLRAVIDYVAKALEGRGTVIVGDCPVQGTSWDRVVRLTGLNEIGSYVAETFPGIDFQLRDYRLAVGITERDWVSGRFPQGDEASGYVRPDLGPYSLLMPLMEADPGVQFGVAQYPRGRMKAAHSLTSNAYVVSRDLLEPDVFVNVPKLKSHQKAGVTCALKNLVGINGHKDCLPHFRFGSPKAGGDEYPDGNWLWDRMWAAYHAEWERDWGLSKRLLRYASMGLAGLLRIAGAPRHFTWLGGGSWYGNDTLWRTVLDLNRTFFYYSPSTGRFLDTPRTSTRYFAIVDGLIGGERESPLAPSPVSSGLVLAGGNPAAVDAVAASCMGFDPNRLPVVREAFHAEPWPLTQFSMDDIVVTGNTPLRTISDIHESRVFVPFVPSIGFRGAIEYADHPVPLRETVGIP